MEDLKYWPLSINRTFIVLLKNQQAWILLAFFNWRHLQKRLWFSVQILSLKKRDSSKWSSFNSFFFSISFFLLATTSYLSWWSLNLRITLPLLFMWWHTFKSLSSTFKPVYGQDPTYLLLNILIRNWYRNWADFDYLWFLTYCAELSAFFQFNNSINKKVTTLLPHF